MGLIRSADIPDEARDYVTVAADRLYPLAWSLSGSRFEAEDLVQDTVVRVLTRWEQVARAERRDAYVRRILVHEFLSGRRRAGRERLLEDPSEPLGDDGPDPMAVSDLRADLWRRLQVLDERQRAVVVLRYLEDLSDTAIAELVDVSPGNVRVIAHRALGRLRPLMETADADSSHMVRKSRT